MLDSTKGLNAYSHRQWAMLLCCTLAVAQLECVAAAATGKQPAAKPSQTLFLQANSLAGNSRYQEALTKYKAALALDPANAKIHHMYGRTLALMGALGEAVVAYRFALSLQKAPSAELENDIGVALATNEELGEAAVHLKKAVTIDPKFISGYNNLGVTMSRLGDYRAARDAFQTSIKLQPSNKKIAEKLSELSAKIAQSKPFDFNNPNAAQASASKNADPANKSVSTASEAKPAEPGRSKPATSSGGTASAAGTESGAPPSTGTTPSTKTTVTTTIIETPTGTRRRTVISTPPVIIPAHKEDRADAIPGVSTSLDSATESSSVSATADSSATPAPVEDSVIMTRTTIDSNTSSNVAGSTNSTTTVTSTSTAPAKGTAGGSSATTGGATPAAADAAQVSTPEAPSAAADAPKVSAPEGPSAPVDAAKVSTPEAPSAPVDAAKVSTPEAPSAPVDAAKVSTPEASSAPVDAAKVSTPEAPSTSVEAPSTSSAETKTEDVPSAGTPLVTPSK